SSVEEYQELAARKTEREVQEKNDKTGVFTGGFVIHPLSGEEIPVWVADYVLAGYGTGAVMGVPAHDQRDWDFANQYNLPVIEVVKGGDVKKAAYVDFGEVINSQHFNGMNSAEAKRAITSQLESIGLGSKQTTYRLRDWLVSRQR